LRSCLCPSLCPGCQDRVATVFAAKSAGSAPLFRQHRLPALLIVGTPSKQSFAQNPSTQVTIHTALSSNGTFAGWCLGLHFLWSGLVSRGHHSHRKPQYARSESWRMALHILAPVPGLGWCNRSQAATLVGLEPWMYWVGNRFRSSSWQISGCYLLLLILIAKMRKILAAGEKNGRRRVERSSTANFPLPYPKG